MNLSSEQQFETDVSPREVPDPVVGEPLARAQGRRARAPRCERIQWNQRGNVMAKSHSLNERQTLR
jgi:hypothetical protein